MTRWIPHFGVGRISGAMLTNGQPGDGWYVAAQWLGWRVIVDLSRAS